METTLHVARAAITSEMKARSSSTLRRIESWRRRHTASTALVLPPVVAELKERIRSSNRPKYFAFSLLEMKKVAKPPVEIPAAYKRRATAVVGGRRVPLTRMMWRRRQRQRPHQLPQISEHADDELAAATERRKTSRRRSTATYPGDQGPLEPTMVWIMQ